ncbi:MAG: ABC transporter ATP-binding protein [Bacteroidales bacterium]|nr:ABC transporter ATP-binding protein [Bacteroidales bacterium]
MKTLPAFIRFNQISKHFGEVKALQYVSLELEEGELMGFIGPDGAGKTTLLRIFTSLMLPDSGSAALGELDVVNDYKKIRQIVGYMPGRFSLYPDLTVEENLHFYARIFNTSLEQNYHLIRDIYGQIEPFKKRRAGDLSGGMKQKLALSCALIHHPRVLVLDEPTTGVDAVSRMEFWVLLKSMQQQGITILVSTPYMDEAAQCDRVALMDHGKVMVVERPSVIEDNYPGQLLSVKTNQMYRLLAELEAYPEVKHVFRFGEVIHMTFNLAKEVEIVPLIKDYLKQRNHEQISVSRIKPGIEDCFLSMMETPQKA